MEKTRLPDFENPPVAEVVLSAQFEPLEHFQVPHIGLLWQEYRPNSRSWRNTRPLRTSSSSSGQRPWPEMMCVSR